MSAAIIAFFAAPPVFAGRLFRGTGKNRVYGGDWFVGAGVWLLLSVLAFVAVVFEIDLALEDSEVGFSAHFPDVVSVA